MPSTNHKKTMGMISHSAPWICSKDKNAIANLLETGLLSNGHEVSNFEEKLKNYTAASGVITCGSGTESLILALLALDINAADEVIVPTYVCKSVLFAIRHIGATPVLCDIEEPWIIAKKDVEKKITKRTKAIIIVHIFGILSPTALFLDFNVPIIEDFCQAFGGRYGQESYPILADLAFFSFHGTKCLTTGEGGAVASNKDCLVERMRDLKDKNPLMSKMSDLQAVLGLSQLKRYDDGLTQRKIIAERYLSEIPLKYTSGMRKIEKTIFFRFLLTTPLTDERFELIKLNFANEGVMVRRGVDNLLHRLEGVSDDLFPGATMAYNSTVSVPIRPALTDAEQAKIIKTINLMAENNAL